MESQQSGRAAERSFQLAHPPARAAAGVAAAVAVASFAYLVFGPLADQRALELAGVDVPASVGSANRLASGAPGAVAAAASAVAPQRLARASGGGFASVLQFGALPP
ncbi:MAG: hypothetical protein ACXWJA_17650 [Caldimonas sp.]